MRTLAIPAMACGLTFGLTSFAESPRPAQGPPANLGNVVLRDVEGSDKSIIASGKPAVVLVFLGVECPLVKLYSVRLNKLAEEFASKNVDLIGIDSNQQDSLEEIAQFIKAQGIKFPILKDPDHKAADLLNARRTPEAFVLDSKLVVRYQGRIDDQYGVGYLKPKASRNDVEIAVSEVLDGKAVSVASTNPPGCIIGRRKQQVGSDEITYTKHIAKILDEHCVNCHRPGEIGPFPMTTYEDVLGWSETIRETVDQGRMPPWFADPHYGDFLDDPRLSDEEKSLIARWVDNGCPKGDPQDQPPPPKFVDGWQMDSPPDVVFQMSDKPYKVPAEGVLDYVYYEIDPKWNEDKWIYGSEARPGDRSVVHHILVFCKRPGKWYPPGLPGELISAYAPGMKQTVGADKSMAALLPKGSKIVMQMHYTPNGVPREDLSYFGIKFADPADIQWEVKPGMAINFVFRIPPHDGNYRVPAMFVFPEDSVLLGVNPHMHLRGKSFVYEAVYPDGRKEVLMNCPKFDFNWQIGYQYREPLPIPKGTKLVCTAHFDNSAKNLSNPDPNRTVRFGEQTWDEMMIGWFYYAVKRDRPVASH